MLSGEPAALSVAVHRSAASNPDGDLLQLDVLQGAADDVIRRLRDLGIEERGSVVLENVDASLSALADRVSARGPRFQQFTPVWAEVEARIRLGASYPPSWFGLLVIAGLIGAVGILTNSQIRSSALVVGFSLAVAATLVLGLVIRWAGLEPRPYALGIRPVSSLIDRPNWFSVIVALLAGVVGVLSITESRSSALIGVFISVTTIPAASDVGVSLAFGSGTEAWGSALQLLLNIVVLTVVAIVGLPAQRAIWRRARAGRRDPATG